MQAETNGKLAPNGHVSTNGVLKTLPITSAAANVDYPPSPYQVLNQYHSKSSKIRIAGAGAGATGICLAYKLERCFEPGTFDLTLFEKNEHFGGTWYENTYPGVACDIPAPMYTYSFDPNPNWSHYYAYGSEIQEYFEDFAKRHGKTAHFISGTQLTSSRRI
jgi:cation diffusion facilitator CzcD-associated flavoprotein CzcO